MTITAATRPFVLTFHATGTSYPLTSEDCQRLLNEYPAVRATRQLVVLPGHNTSDPAQRCSIRPATIGGGDAFTIERPAMLYGVFHDAAKTWGMDRSKARAIKAAKKVGGYVTAMRLPDRSSRVWDAPTFRVCSDLVADFRA